MMMSGMRLVVVVVVTLLANYGRCHKWNMSMTSSIISDHYMEHYSRCGNNFIGGHLVYNSRGRFYISLNGNNMGVTMDKVLERLHIEWKQHLDSAVICLVKGKTDCFHIFEQMEDYIAVDGMFRIYPEIDAHSGYNGKSHLISEDRLRIDAFSKKNYLIDVELGYYDYSAIALAMGSPLCILNHKKSILHVTDISREHQEAGGLRKSSKSPVKLVNRLSAELSPTSFNKLPTPVRSIKSSKSRVASLTSGSSVGSKSQNASKPTAILDGGVLADLLPQATTSQVNNEYLSYDLIERKFYIHGYEVRNGFFLLLKNHVDQQVHIDVEELHQEYKAMIGQHLTKTVTCFLEENCVGFHTFFIQHKQNEMRIDGACVVRLGETEIKCDRPQFIFSFKTESTTSQLFEKVERLGLKHKYGDVFLTVNADANMFTHFE